MNAKTIFIHSHISVITSREFQVLQLIADEWNTKEIADKLFISFDTVKSHRKNLFVKLKARNVAGLIRKSYESGILKVNLDEAKKTAFLRVCE